MTSETYLRFVTAGVHGAAVSVFTGATMVALTAVYGDHSRWLSALVTSVAMLALSATMIRWARQAQELTVRTAALRSYTSQMIEDSRYRKALP